jgi:hypothetical protein
VGRGTPSGGLCVDTFWIKLIVLAILAGIFVVTIWLTPLFFASGRKGRDDA